MKKLILKILLQAALMALMILVAIQVAVLGFMLPSPIHIIATFLGWVGLGITWQEVAQRFPGWLGLEKTSSSATPREP